MALIASTNYSVVYPRACAFSLTRTSRVIIVTSGGGSPIRRAFVHQADLAASGQAAALIDQAAADLGRIDVLVNMASVYAAVPFDETDERVWDTVVNVDLTAAFLCARAAVPHMRGIGGGRIVNFTDWVAASRGPRYKGYLPYYVAKSGVIGLTEALALELAGDGILVNAVAPGPILAPEDTTDAEYQAVEAATPLGRWGGEAEICQAVVFLLESEFVTGETIRVDGGRHDFPQGTRSAPGVRTPAATSSSKRAGLRTLVATPGGTSSATTRPCDVIAMRSPASIRRM